MHKFVCLYRVSRPTREFFTHMETSPLQILKLCSVLMAIEQWGFFSVLHLLWHDASVYHGHLLGPVTLIRLAVELSPTVCRDRDSNTQPSACGAYVQTHCATAHVHVYLSFLYRTKCVSIYEPGTCRCISIFYLQDEVNQVLTTSVWLEQVSTCKSSPNPRSTCLFSLNVRNSSAHTMHV